MTMPPLRLRPLPLVLLVLLLAATAGCGNKGDLVRPSAPATPAQG